MTAPKHQKKIPYQRGRKWVGTVRASGLQRWVSADSKTEWKVKAQLRRAELIQEAGEQQQARRRQRTIREWIEAPQASRPEQCRWLTLNPRNKESSNEKLAQDIKPLLRDFGDHKWAEIERIDAREWMVGQTVNTIKACRSCWNDAVNAGETDAPNPFNKPRIVESRGRKDITVLTEEDVELLCECAREVHPDAYGLVMVALIKVAAFTALRPGELFAMTWTDLRLDEREYDVRFKFDGKGRYNDPKSEAGYRTVVVPQEACEAIRQMPRTHEEWVFTAKRGGSFKKNVWSHYWGPLRAAFMAKLPKDHQLHQRMAKVSAEGRDPATCRAEEGPYDFYELRHFGATRFLELGASAEDVAGQLGHADPTLVWSTYGHPDKRLARERLKALDVTSEDLAKLTQAEPPEAASDLAG